MKQFLKLHRPDSTAELLIQAAHIVTVEDVDGQAAIHVVGIPGPILTQETYEAVKLKLTDIFGNNAFD
ncbi:hypothetical protein GCM10023189_28080 [Nibrella saemangeumensis]|uniref:Uncharacterized protein n=1 Tax=Nibrella saemangeumensis TaxID=1084526 RepID=A0ABP8MWX9_9BACT